MSGSEFDPRDLEIAKIAARWRETLSMADAISVAWEYVAAAKKHREEKELAENSRPIFPFDVAVKMITSCTKIADATGYFRDFIRDCHCVPSPTMSPLSRKMRDHLLKTNTFPTVEEFDAAHSEIADEHFSGMRKQVFSRPEIDELQVSYLQRFPRRHSRNTKKDLGGASKTKKGKPRIKRG